MKRVYFDHAATTPTDPVIARTVYEYMTEFFGNPGSVHSFGRQARQAVDVAGDSDVSVGAGGLDIFVLC